jgi:hypothetical protein
MYFRNLGLDRDSGVEAFFLIAYVIPQRDAIQHVSLSFHRVFERYEAGERFGEIDLFSVKADAVTA